MLLLVSHLSKNNKKKQIFPFLAKCMCWCAAYERSKEIIIILSPNSTLFQIHVEFFHCVAFHSLHSKKITQTYYLIYFMNITNTLWRDTKPKKCRLGNSNSLPMAKSHLKLQ